MMYKVNMGPKSNKMGPKSLTNLFSYKCEKTNYNLRDISSGLNSLPKPRTNNIKIVSCMTEHTFGILFQRKLGKAKLFHPSETKSLLTKLT
jgi:hypothetical protein